MEKFKGWVETETRGTFFGDIESQSAEMEGALSLGSTDIVVVSGVRGSKKIPATSIVDSDKTDVCPQFACDLTIPMAVAVPE